MMNNILTTTTVTLAQTRSGSRYVTAGSVLLVFKGYGVQAFNLESGLSPWEVNGHVKALVLPEDGAGVGRVASTRIIRVDTWSDRMTAQENAMCEMAYSFAQVGKVFMDPTPTPGPLQAALRSAKADGAAWDAAPERIPGAKKGERGYQPATTVAPCEPRSHKPGCVCTSSTDCCEGTPVRHEGSSRCQSGSIASGGTRSHCTCDRCF